MKILFLFNVLGQIFGRLIFCNFSNVFQREGEMGGGGGGPYSDDPPPLPACDLDGEHMPFMKAPFCIYTGHSADLLDISWSKVRLTNLSIGLGVSMVC
jgi:hypothetical protein